VEKNDGEILDCPVATSQTVHFALHSQNHNAIDHSPQSTA